VTLTLVISGAPLTLTCTAYPNGATPSSGGLATGPPTGSPIAPVIALTSGEGGSTTTSTSSTTTTTQPTTSTTTTQPTACKPGWGFGDKNHCHSGPPGQGGSPPPGAGQRAGHLDSVRTSAFQVKHLGMTVGPSLVLLGLCMLALTGAPRRLLVRLAHAANHRAVKSSRPINMARIWHKLLGR
jgi:hypothetical protein